MDTVDEYLDAAPREARATLERVRAIVAKALPACAEGISYQMPVLKLEGRMVLYYAGYREHWAIYPASERVRAELGAELGDRLHSKGTIRFALGEVPVRLITKIAKVRAAEAAELNAAKKAAPRAGTKGAAKERAGTKRTTQLRARRRR